MKSKDSEVTIDNNDIISMSNIEFCHLVIEQITTKNQNKIYQNKTKAKRK